MGHGLGAEALSSEEEVRGHREVRADARHLCDLHAADWARGLAPSGLCQQVQGTARAHARVAAFKQNALRRRIVADKTELLGLHNLAVSGTPG